MPELKVLQARLVAESNITLSGTGQPLDDRTIAPNDVIFTPNQTVQSDRGLWVAASGSWTRDTSFDMAAEMLKGTLIVITDGSGNNKNSVWMHTTDGAIGTVGSTPGTSTTALSFQREQWGQGAAQQGTGIERDGSAWNLTATGIDPGTYGPFVVDTEGRVQDAVVEEQGSTFIEGLRLVRVSDTALRLEEGGAYIPDTGGVLEAPDGVDLTSLSLTANSWYYTYLFTSAGAAAAELVGNAPDTPYRGDARTKQVTGTPILTHRFTGSVRSGATANTIRPFERYPDGELRYLEDPTASPYRVLTNGTATALTTVSCAAVVPPTSRRAKARLTNTGGNNADFFIPGVTPKINRVGPNMEKEIDLDLDASQQFQYQMSASAANGLYVDILGYFEGR
jgi:hypothetical protein